MIKKPYSNSPEHQELIAASVERESENIFKLSMFMSYNF